MTGRADYYADGDWNALCWECGRKHKASQLIKHWQGYYVCRRCWEPRHPQDFVRATPDVQTPPWTQPVPAVPVSRQCFPNGTSAVPGYSVPGCMIPGYISPFFDTDVGE